MGVTGFPAKTLLGATGFRVLQGWGEGALAQPPQLQTASHQKTVLKTVSGF
jgi:hypothetical protein